MSKVTKMSNVVSELEALFDLLNTVYFEDKLERPIITVQSKPQAYGHCSVKKIWESDTTAKYEINISSEWINRPADETAATMCHEMIHLYCLMNDISDTSQNYRYHNKSFKREAEARDLEIEYSRVNGYSHTKPTDAFREKVQWSPEIIICRKAPETVKRERKKIYKYICPNCGQEVRSSSILNINCGFCDVTMEAR